MVRPKASLEMLQISGAYAEAVTVRLVTSSAIKYPKIACKGFTSIFAALKIGLPNMIRSGREPAMNGAVNEIQLNKYLIRIGFKAYRYRKRVIGKSDQWSKGLQLWQNLRWVNVDDPEELRIMRQRLSELTARFPKKLIFLEDRLLDFLSSVNSLAETDAEGYEDISPSLCSDPPVQPGSEYPNEPQFSSDYELHATGRRSCPTLEERPFLPLLRLAPKRHLSTRNRFRSTRRHFQMQPLYSVWPAPLVWPSPTSVGRSRNRVFTPPRRTAACRPPHAAHRPAPYQHVAPPRTTA
jgi:hypothetical protein